MRFACVGGCIFVSNRIILIDRVEIILIIINKNNLIIMISFFKFNNYDIIDFDDSESELP